jgi:hypothetical protein
MITRMNHTFVHPSCAEKMYASMTIALLRLYLLGQVASVTRTCIFVCSSLRLHTRGTTWPTTRSDKTLHRNQNHPLLQPLTPAHIYTKKTTSLHILNFRMWQGQPGYDSQIRTARTGPGKADRMILWLNFERTNIEQLNLERLNLWNNWTSREKTESRTSMYQRGPNFKRLKIAWIFTCK